MIIQALVDYASSNADLAPFGYSVLKVSFTVVLEPDGRLVQIQDARVDQEPPDGQAGKDTATKIRKVPQRLIAPAIPGRTVKVTPGFLCDTPAYIFGFAGEAKAAKPGRIRECFEAFRARHLGAQTAVNDAGFDAVCAFLRAWKPVQLDERRPVERSLLEEPGFGVFQLRGQAQFIHERDAVRAYWDSSQAAASPAHGGTGADGAEETTGAVFAPSLVNGQTQELARLHEPAIKGVAGAQTSGAKLASFNCDAFESYGKRQTYNAPIGVRDAFAYCTALNHLLCHPRHRARLGDTTVVFWTARLVHLPVPETPNELVSFEDAFSAFIAGGGPQDAVRLSHVRTMLDLARDGRWSDIGDPATDFFILGLAPNASRIAVRFWIRTTVSDILGNLRKHMDALTLDGAPERFASPTLQQVARETLMAKNGWPDEDRLPPNLVEQLARSSLLGLPYPPALLGAVVQRARTDGWVNPDARAESRFVVQHRRACIIAACLRRSARPMEIPMSLDESLADRPYLLGRLFAVLDTIAEEASERKVTRRDKYFASASANPSTVFPRLLRLANFDLKKMPVERRVFRRNAEHLIQSICDRINPSNPFPAFLTLTEQGQFCIGYYQQRQSAFPRKDTEPPKAATAS